MRLSYPALPLAALAAAMGVTVSKTEIAPPDMEPVVQLATAPSSSAVQETDIEASKSHALQVDETRAGPVRPSMSRHEVVELVDVYAREHGVPIRFARAVVHVESSYKPEATGSVGEVGLMQLKYNTARLLGFKGSYDDLYEPAFNLYFGMKYLAGAWKLGGQTLCGAVIRYQGGHARKTHTSVSRRYCEKVKKFMASN